MASSGTMEANIFAGSEMANMTASGLNENKDSAESVQAILVSSGVKRPMRRSAKIQALKIEIRIFGSLLRGGRRENCHMANSQ
ncbi:hypothetical protein SUGI_0845100 [Cryptomeria japonica]|nr:hypothetical protein SUGI_0845100 [Cryptomeria japonica]